MRRGRGRFAAAVEGVEGALQEAVSNDGVPASRDDGEAHVGSAEVTFGDSGETVQRVFGLPEAEFQFRGELCDEEAAFPVSRLDRREDGSYFFGAMFSEKPLFDEGVDVVELCDFDEDGGYGRGTARDELEVAEGSEEGNTTALGILPALTLLKSESGKETSKTIKLSARCTGRGHGADERDSLNHRFDCIVWEYRQDCCNCRLD
jgi:hypothetical protein